MVDEGGSFIGEEHRHKTLTKILTITEKLHRWKDEQEQWLCLIKTEKGKRENWIARDNDIARVTCTDIPKWAFHEQIQLKLLTLSLYMFEI